MNNKPGKPDAAAKVRQRWMILGGGCAAGCLIMLAIPIAAVFYLVVVRNMATRPSASLAEARADHETQLVDPGPAPDSGYYFPDEVDYTNLFFESDGRLLFGAFAKDEDATEPQPLVVYCHGGLQMSEGDLEYARRFREAGYAVFVPAWRGENGNPGNHEFYLGEVDDLINAVEFAASLESIDENNVFIFGHSAGGTLGLLAAELSQRPKAVAACGATPSMELAAASMLDSGQSEVPYDAGNSWEHILRSPYSFIKDLNCPVQLLYGEREEWLIQHARSMRTVANRLGKQVELDLLVGQDHFTAVKPALARAIAYFDKQQNKPHPNPAPPVFAAGKQPFCASYPEWVAGLSQQRAPAKSAPESQVDSWVAVVDPGPAPIDWSCLASGRDNGLIARSDYRLLPGGRWAVGKIQDSFLLLKMDVSRQMLIQEFPVLFNAAYEHSGRVASVAYDGNHFAMHWRFRATKGSLVSRDIVTLHRCDDASLVRHFKDFSDARFVSSNRLLLTRIGSKTHFICFDLDEKILGKTIQFGIEGRAVTTVSPGAKYAVFLKRDKEDAVLEVRDLLSGATVTEGRYTHTPVGGNVAVSTDGKFAATVSEGWLSVWSLEDGTLRGQAQVDMQFSQTNWLNGNQYLLLGDRQIVDSQTLRPLASLPPLDSTPGESPNQHGAWTWHYQQKQYWLRRIPLEQIPDAAEAATFEKPPRIRLKLSLVEGEFTDAQLDQLTEDLVRHLTTVTGAEVVTAGLADFELRIEGSVILEYDQDAFDELQQSVLANLSPPARPALSVIGQKIGTRSLAPRSN